MHTPKKLAYATALLRSDPFELLRLLSVGWTTAKYRYLRRCVGRGTTVEPRTQIINAANVRIGRDVLLKEAIYIRAGAQGQVEIGDRAAINGFCRIFGHGGVAIGEDSQLGPGCLITTTDHDYRKGLAIQFKRVVIGRRVWVGANVTILPGVEIGDEAVIGAGSVVTKSIPARCIAVGVPARVVRTIDEPAQQKRAEALVFESRGERIEAK